MPYIPPYLPRLYKRNKKVFHKAGIIITKYFFTNYSLFLYFLVVALILNATPKTVPITADVVEKQISRTETGNEPKYLVTHPEIATIQTGAGAKTRENNEELQLHHFSNVTFQDDSEPESDFSSVSLTSEQEEEVEYAFSHPTVKVQQLGKPIK